MIPPLVEAYLKTIHQTLYGKPKKGYVPLTHAICYILNLFCKVRGEKIVKGFLNNEPRHLEPILDQLESGRNFRSIGDDPTHQSSVVPWAERYVLLLWLSHLMLAPFPLESISTLQPSEETASLLGIELPPEAPGVTLRVLTICFNYLSSASKEREAAANLLVKMCVRPDMQQLGMLQTVIKWSTRFFINVSANGADIHQCLGVLSFLSGLVASATNEEIGAYLPAIYQSCRSVLDHESLASIKSSAVARKLVVKILRNIVLHSLRSDAMFDGLDATSILEEVIEYLLEAVADGDSPVRYGASKALSIITLKLDQEMADEVVEALLGSLNENVYWQNSTRNLGGVNPLRWHGLTLTLSHLLYRKAIPTASLPQVLNALLLSLGFEQRSPTGGSIGTNVRDAACFGIWALSRRYSTSDLLQIETSSIRACEHRKTLSVPQALAIELVTAACLDPAGNIRRGSSAALQELIGRHPNTIKEGIPLVQIVDFHAVGLRQRALCDVAIQAGDLESLYWESLFENLLGWRGTGSLDADSRLSSGRAVGFLSRKQDANSVRRMSDQICTRLSTLRPREVEERQGLVSALAAIVTSVCPTDIPRIECSTKIPTVEKSLVLVHLWELLDRELLLEDKAFTSPALRPELTASSMSHFIAAMSVLTIGLSGELRPKQLPITRINKILNLCLARHEQGVLEAIIVSTPAVLALFSSGQYKERDTMVGEWLSKLENEGSYNGVRCSGHAVALGSAYSVLSKYEIQVGDDEAKENIPERIISILTFRCTPAVAIEARVVALRALHALVETTHQLTSPVKNQISIALHIALNDYTVTERGDVGSLVRLQALETVASGWTTNVLDTENSRLLYSDVIRLSLEKLDKVRSRAANVLTKYSFSEVSILPEDVSSTGYFFRALQMLQSESSPVNEGICLGFISSASMGSESVLQNARLALLQFLETLPEVDTTAANRFSLENFSTCVTDILRRSISDDRISIPVLEMVAFLLDMQVLQRLTSTSFRYVQ